ncbi:carboxypeptidase-like regulatory domain-containing protein [Candidatus Latescibacterota bacterium]
MIDILYFALPSSAEGRNRYQGITKAIDKRRIMKTSYKNMILLSILLCCSQMAQAQEKYTISGTVADAETGEILIGVGVYEKGTSNGTMTNDSGFYSLTLAKGTHKITYAFVGYERIEKDIDFNENISSHIKLKPSPLELDEVVITSKQREDENVTSTEVSVEKLDIQQVEKIPVIMGETDIMKTIQLLPGITSIAEGRSGFIVRGSGIDQNLILMDGMPLYYSSHMQGLYSVFNSDAVDELTVYKGGIPARFGGRGASVLDVRMKESNFDEYRAKLSLGLITSKFSVEAPIIKDKLSVFLAGRSTKTSLGHFYDKRKDDDGVNTGGKGGGKGGSGSAFRFFDPYESWLDFNGKIIYKVNDNNTLYLSAYAGRDSALVAGGLTEWGNHAASLRWNHLFNSKMLSNTSLIYSRYYTKQTGGIYKFHSGIETTSFK